MSVPQKVLRTEQWMQMSEVRRPIIRGLVFIRFTTRGGKKRRWARSDRGPRVSQIVRVTVQGLVKIKYDCRTEKTPPLINQSLSDVEKLNVHTHFYYFTNI